MGIKDVFKRFRRSADPIDPDARYDVTFHMIDGSRFIFKGVTGTELQQLRNKFRRGLLWLEDRNRMVNTAIIRDVSYELTDE